jgi:hypothetical protein
LQALISGTWSGFLRVDTCTDSQFPACAVNPVSAFQFTLVKDASGWTGTVRIDEPSAKDVTVRGVEAPGAASVTFTGTAASPEPDGWAATVSELHLRPDPGSGLVGTLAYSYRHAGRSDRRVEYTGTIASAARGTTPPPPTPFMLDGEWQVSALLESCLTYRGEPCGGSLPDSQTWLLVIRDSAGPAPRAMVQFPSNTLADLVGTREPDGTIRFAGGLDTPWDAYFRVEVPTLVVAPDPQAGFTGRFEYRRHHGPARNHDGGVAVHAGSIVSATRGAVSFSPGVFQGSWHGAVVPAGCVAGDCSQAEQDIRDVRLTLTQSGDAVAGSITIRGGPTPVSGSATGRTASLGGEITFPVCTEFALYRDVCGLRIRDAVLTIDEFGRVSGELEFTLQERRVPYTARVRLVAVVPDL